MTKINELNTELKEICVEAMVIGETETREVNTRNGPTNVNNTMIGDETGDIKLVTWGEENPILKKGKRIKVSGGYITEFRGNLQLNVGRMGELVEVKNVVRNRSN